MKAILKVVTYKSKQQALSHCAHILRKHGHPEEGRQADIITIVDRTNNTTNDAVKTQPEAIKQLQTNKRSLSKKLAVYQKRYNGYIIDNKFAVANKQKLKIDDLQAQLTNIDIQLNSIDTFAKTAIKSNSVKYVELVMAFTDTPPTNSNADDLSELSKEFLIAKFGEDFYNNAIAVAVHKDQHSIHTHAIFELQNNWYSTLKYIDKDPRKALSMLNYEFNNYCKDKLHSKYKFENLTSGNEYLPLFAFKQKHANMDYQKEQILQSIETSINQGLSDFKNIELVITETLKSEIVLNATLTKVVKRTMTDRILKSDTDFISETKSNLTTAIQTKSFEQLLNLSPTIKRLRKSSVNFEFTLSRIKELGKHLKDRLTSSISYILTLSENELFRIRRKAKPYLNQPNASLLTPEKLKGCDSIESPIFDNPILSPDIQVEHISDVAKIFDKFTASTNSQKSTNSTTSRSVNVRSRNEV